MFVNIGKTNTSRFFSCTLSWGISRKTPFNMTTPFLEPFHPILPYPLPLFSSKHFRGLKTICIWKFVHSHPPASRFWNEWQILLHYSQLLKKKNFSRQKEKTFFISSYAVHNHWPDAFLWWFPFPFHDGSPGSHSLNNHFLQIFVSPLFRSVVASTNMFKFCLVKVDPFCIAVKWRVN